MPPKRKAAAAKGAAKGPGGKKAKKGKAAAGDASAGTSQPEDAEKKAMAALKSQGKKTKVFQVDSHCGLSHSGGKVYEDYDCMLNQTNIGHNNNKYYVIQVIEQGGTFYTWNRWGRVGEGGQNKLSSHGSVDDAIKDFEKKFRDKTKNKWEDRENFEPQTGKYTLIEMDGESEDEADQEKEAKLDVIDGLVKKTLPCTLGKETQSLIDLIFSNDMFKEAMQKMDIDVKKMPLGKLSKSQISKGFDVLEELEGAVKLNQKKKLEDLTSRFYTLIPHDFGRQRPPTINTLETVRQKKDMLLVLADIEIAQEMQKKRTITLAASKVQEVPHPLDGQYNMLNCKLEHIPKSSKDFKLMNEYVNNTGSKSWRKCTLANLWTVDREDEGERFQVHDKVGNRKLLWHGTNVAVVAAILKSGLRIMPHSGGRVGAGIYFASENSKSAGYGYPESLATSYFGAYRRRVRPAGKRGIMFLNEVVLGKEHIIKQDDWTLKAAPKGYNSIIAKGHTEPDPKANVEITLDGHKVVVPKGKVINVPGYNNSSFSQSEYLVYREDQCRIRYMLEVLF